MTPWAAQRSRDWCVRGTVDLTSMFVCDAGSNLSATALLRLRTQPMSPAELSSMFSRTWLLGLRRSVEGNQ
jgi:hypothetical protein